MKIIVPTCRSYADAWEPFHGLMSKFWLDCPYPVFTVTDFMPSVYAPHKGENYIVLGMDYGWCMNIAKAMEQEPDDFYLILQEDFFFSDKVDQTLVESALSLLKARPEAAMVRLMPCPGPDIDVDKDFGKILYKSPYRVSCQATIWKKEPLLTILRSVQGSAIDFEIKGQSVDLSKWEFFCAHRILPFRFPYLVSAISRGQWNPDALKLCKEHGIYLDSSKRPVEIVSK